MSDQTSDNQAQDVLREIRAMHQDMARMHGELIAALRIMTSLAAQVRDLRDAEGQVQSVMGTLAQRLADLPGLALADQSLCPECGGPLSHHQAPAGDLRICTSCGWSRFYGRGAVPAQVPSPAPVPEPAETEAWTR